MVLMVVSETRCMQLLVQLQFGVRSASRPSTTPAPCPLPLVPCSAGLGMADGQCDPVPLRAPCAFSLLGVTVWPVIRFLIARLCMVLIGMSSARAFLNK